MIIKTKIFNNTYDVLRIKKIDYKILDQDKTSESKVWYVSEDTYDNRIKSIIKPFCDISFIRVLDTTFDEYSGHIYLYESIYFDSTRYENVSLVTPIESSFKRKFLITNLIDTPISIISNDYLKNKNDDDYIEFEMSLDENSIIQSVKEYLKTVGLKLDKIKGIRFYENLNGFFLSSYLLLDPYHQLKCMKMEEDIPVGIKCDHLYRSYKIEGEFLYYIMNSDNSILRLYNNGLDQKIFGRLTFKTIKRLYNEFSNILNRTYNNILNNRDFNIKEIILPYVQIPIGFDVVYSLFGGKEYLINIKIWSYILFDLFKENENVASNVDRIESIKNIVSKEVTIYPENFVINSLTNEKVKIYIPSSLILNIFNRDVIDIKINNISNSNNNIKFYMLPRDLDTTINTPFNIRLLGINNNNNLIYNYYSMIEYDRTESSDATIYYNVDIDGTNFNLKNVFNIIKEQPLGRLSLILEYSDQGGKIYSNSKIVNILKIKNIHKNTKCKIEDFSIECYIYNGYSIENIDKSFYYKNVNLDLIGLDVTDEEIVRIDTIFNDNIFNRYNLENKNLIIEFKIKYRDLNNNLLESNKITVSYSGIDRPSLEVNFDKIKYIPINKLQEVPIGVRIRGGTIKRVKVEDLGNNPEKMVFGRNIFIMNEDFPIISDSNGKFSLFFRIKNKGKYKIRIYFELEGLMDRIIYKDVYFNAIDIDTDLLKYAESFYVDNNVYHVSLTYNVKKETIIKIKNISEIPIKINNIGYLIPRSSRDIYNVENVRFNISNVNINNGDWLNPGEEIVILCDFLAKDFGYNLILLFVDVDIFGRHYFPISTFTNRNILRNVYVSLYKHYYDEILAVKDQYTRIGIMFKNYGDDVCLIKNQSLGYDKNNIIVNEYSLAMPNSVSFSEVIYRPTIEGRRYGYVYSEILSQIEAFILFQSDQTTIYKIHNPGILFSFIANVLIEEGTLVRSYTNILDKVINFDSLGNLVLISVRNIGFNPVEIEDVIINSNIIEYLEYQYVSNNILRSNEKADIFLVFKDNIKNKFTFNESNIQIKYKDIEFIKNKICNIPFNISEFIFENDLIINNSNIDFEYINVTETREEYVEIFNNTNENIVINIDYTGSHEIKSINGIQIFLRPRRTFTFPVGIYCNTIGIKHGIIRIRYRIKNENKEKIIYIKGNCIDTNYINIK